MTKKQLWWVAAGSLLLGPTFALVVTASPLADPPASPLPAGVQATAAVEGLREYRLANGLRVVLFPDPSKQMTTVNVTYLAGSRHEGYGETGMAHLLEHMLFKGTPRHPDIPKELTAHGCRPNGTTWYDRTNYFETFATSEENLDWALDLEADRMVNSFLARRDLDSEFSVVRNEFEIGENYPQGVLLDRIFSTAYLWHNYGKSTIGSRSDIERVSIDSLQAFYRLWYQPDNAFLVVAGKLDEAKTLEKIVRTFGAIPKPSRALPATYTVEPPQDGERTVTLRRVGDTQMAAVGYHVPPGPHQDFAAIDLLSLLLGSTPAGRLHKALVEGGRAASVFSFDWSLHDPGMLVVGAEVRSGSSLPDARDILVRVTEETGGSEPKREEIDRARESWLKGWDTTMRSSESAAIALSDWAAQGDWRLMFLHRDRIKAVTPADVQRVAKAYLRPENRTVGLYLPSTTAQRVAVPPAPDVAALVDGYKGGEALALGEEFDPSPAAIEARILRAKVAPGIKLALLPKKTRGATVQVAMTFRVGDEKSLRGRGEAGTFAARMLMRGTATRTRQQIQDELDRLKAQLNLDGGAGVVSASLEVPRLGLPAALRLTAEILRAPSFPATELELLRQETLADLENGKSDPGQKASSRLWKHLTPWSREDPRYVESPEESIAAAQAVTLDEIKRFHADFYGAAAAEIALVGDFDPEKTKALLAELFAGWKNAKPYARLVSPYQERPVIREKIEAPDKESAFFLAGLRIDLQDKAPEYPALVLGNFMTGGGFLNSRLAARIRQKEGISYGIGSFFSASALESDAIFGSYAIYAPQNSKRLTTAFSEEMERVVAEGFKTEEIAEAKKGWLQERQVARASDRELCALLAEQANLGRTMAWERELERRVLGLGNDEIQAAMRKHIDPARISVVEAGDFAKAEAAKIP